MTFILSAIRHIDCAYLDPNVGGWLFQLLFPVVVAIGGFGMVLRRRIKSLWARIFGRQKELPSISDEKNTHH